MATTVAKGDTLTLGGQRGQIWTITAGSSDTDVTWDTGWNSVTHVSATTDTDQSFGGVFLNFSDAGSTVAAGQVHIAGVANDTILNVLTIGH